MLGNVENVNRCFPKPQMMPSNVLLYLQPKDIQFTIIEESNETKNVLHLNRLIDHQNSWRFI